MNASQIWSQADRNTAQATGGGMVFQNNAPLIVEQLRLYASSDESLLEKLEKYACNFTSTRNTMRQTCTQGTCKWITTDEVGEFRKLVRSKVTSFLWILGMPGSGKSHIAHYLCRYFETKYLRGKRGCLVYFFFDSKTPGRNVSSLESFYPTILHQLLMTIPQTKSKLRERCFEIVRKHVNRGSESTVTTPATQSELATESSLPEDDSDIPDDDSDIPDDDSDIPEDKSDGTGDESSEAPDPMRDAIREILLEKDVGPAYLIIDALDECSAASESVAGLEVWLKELNGFPQLRAIITCRPSRDIEKIANDSVGFIFNLHSALKLSNKDIGVHINARIKEAQEAERLPSPLLHLPGHLLEKSNGMFLYAKLLLDILVDTAAADETTLLEKVDELPADLSKLYANRLDAISKQPETTKFVDNIFHWLVTCKQPPTIDCLRSVDRIRRALKDSDSFELAGRAVPVVFDDGLFRNHLLRACLPLVEIVDTEHGNIVRFVHASIPQFLTGLKLGVECIVCPERFQVNVVQGHEFIAMSCVAYLRWPLGESEHPRDKDLRDYAVLEWPEHSRVSEENIMKNEGEQQNLASFCREPAFEDWMSARAGLDNLFRVHFGLNNGSSILPKPLHVAVYFNVWQLGLLFLEDINAADATGATPLHIAAGRSSSKILRGLLDKGAKMNIADREGSLPLHRAVRRKNFQAVSELLAKDDTGMNASDRYKVAPLHIACHFGWKQGVELLLSHKADVLNDCGGAELPISLAIENGHFDIVQLLLHSNQTLISHCGKSVIQAARKGWVETVKFLVEKGADVTYRDWLGQTVLHKACIAQNVELVRYLLEKNVRPDPIDQSKRTPLYFAAEKGSLEIVDCLIQHGADVNILDRRYETPLFKPAGKGHLKVVERLLDAGTNASKLDMWQRTPLRFAAMKGHAEIVRVLLKTDIDQDLPDWIGRTVLHNAAAWLRDGQEQVIDLLFEHNARPDKRENIIGGTALHVAILRENGQPKPSLALIDRLIKHGVPLDVRDRYHRSALNLAALTENAGIVKRLLELSPRLDDESFLVATQSGDIDLVGHFLNVGPHLNLAERSWDYMTALHFAASLGYPDIVAALLAAGAPTQCLNRDRMTPLLCAENAGHSAIVELLRQADPIAADYPSRVETNLWGRSLLHWAAQDGKELDADMLLGANLNSQDVIGRTPLHLAVLAASLETVQQLLSAHADPNLSDEIGQTALHYAAVTPNTAIVEAIITATVDVNALDRWSRTPLHLAAETGGPSTVRLLLDAGSRLLVDHQGQNPLVSAVVHGHDEALRELLKIKGVGNAIAKRDRRKRSVLHTAAKYGRDDMVEHLLGHVDTVVVDMRDDSDKTAMHLASEQGHVHIVRRLLEAGALAYRVDKNRFMAAHYAAAAGHTAIVEMLLDAIPGSVQRCFEKWDQSLPSWASREDGADSSFLEALCTSKALVQVSEENGWTAALHIWRPENRQKLTTKVIAHLNAWDQGDHSIPSTILFRGVLYGHTDTVRLILQKVPSMPLETRSYEHSQVLTVAAAEGYEQIVHLLLDAGSNVTAVTDAQVTCLHEAARNGHATIVGLLLERGANPDMAVLRAGSTPLHLAATGGHADAVRALIAMAFVNTADDLGRTALHLACLNGHEEVVEVLLDAKANVLAQDLEKKTPLAVVKGLSEEMVRRLQAQADMEMQAMRLAAG